MKRIGVIAVIIEKNSENVKKVNMLLSEYGDIIKGRMGLPNVKDDVCVISVIIEASSDEVGALTGKLGRIEGVTVKSMMATK